MILQLTEELEWRQSGATRAPLPVGERSAHAVRRVRGTRTIESARPPHPLASLATSPHRTRVYPSSAFDNWPKSETSDFGWGEVDSRRGGAMPAIPSLQP